MEQPDKNERIYQCVSCQKFWNGDVLQRKETNLYGKKIEEKVCPCCGKRVVLQKDHKFFLQFL